MPDFNNGEQNIWFLYSKILARTQGKLFESYNSTLFDSLACTDKNTLTLKVHIDVIITW